MSGSNSLIVANAFVGANRAFPMWRRDLVSSFYLLYFCLSSLDLLKYFVLQCTNLFVCFAVVLSYWAVTSLVYFCCLSEGDKVCVP